MPRKIAQPEIADLTVAVMKRGGSWCIVDENNATIAGITQKAYAAIASGRALGAGQMREFYGDWGMWARAALDRLRARSHKPLSPWGRRFQAMAQSARRRTPKPGAKRGKKRHADVAWGARMRALVAAAASNSSRQRRNKTDEWTQWAAAADRNLRHREAIRKAKCEEAATAAGVAR